MNPYHNYTDVDLVTRLVQGDSTAFEFIYRTYVKELYIYIRRRISVSEDCEEIIHSVFESLWKRRHELGHITALKSYLYSSARFRAISYLRDEAVRKKHEEYFSLFESVYDNSNPEVQADPDALKALINNAINDLPGRCQEAVRMRVQQNLSNDEIALRMNINKRTVQNYMVTAFNHFRSVYGELSRQSLVLLFALLFLP